MARKMRLSRKKVADSVSKISPRERELAHTDYLMNHIQQYLDRYAKPRQDYPRLREGLDELAKERYLQVAEVDGLASRREERKEGRKE